MAKVPIKVFIIYYGSWSSSEVNIVENFINSLSNNNTTPKDAKAVSAWQWWQIVTWYTMKRGSQTVPVSSQVQFRKRVFDKYSLGKVIRDDLGGVWQIIEQQLRTQALPIDSSAQYLVLTSADVALGDREKGFCGRSGGDAGTAGADANAASIAAATIEATAATAVASGDLAAAVACVAVVTVTAAVTRTAAPPTASSERTCQELRQEETVRPRERSFISL
ncbi:unnamed protein product [Closterium sp. NIES-53]